MSHRELEEDSKLKTMDYRRVLSFGFPFEALNRDLWLICLSNVIAALGEGLYFWFFPLYIRSLQATPVEVGTVLSFLWGTSAVTPIIGGFIADRYDRKKIIIFGWALWVFTPLVYSSAYSWPQLIPGAILWGGSMIAAPAANAYIVTATQDKGKVSSVLSFVWSTYSFSYIFAPAVVGYLIDAIGMRSVLHVATVLSALATAVLLFMRSQHAEPMETASQPEEVSRVHKENFRKVMIWSLFFAVAALITGVARSYVQLFLQDEGGLNDLEIGLFGSLSSLGITVLGVLVGRTGDRWQKKGTIAVCLFGYVVCVSAIALLRNPLLLQFVAFIYGGSITFGTLISSFVGRVSPSTHRGQWMSIPQVASMLAFLGASYAGGYMYSISSFYPFIFSVIATFPLVFVALKLPE